MADGEVDDYMSDTFLASDTTPGLMPKIYLEKHKRKEKSMSRHVNPRKPLKVQEVEKREERLKVALDESNKGFKMLSKMGFKSGMGLGKKGQGISEPIPLQIKQGRKGLGKEIDEDDRKKRYMEAQVIKFKRRKIDEEKIKGEFKTRMRDKHNERQSQSDLYKSQKACHHLDSLKKLEAKYIWFWPIVKIKDVNEAEEIEEEEEEEEDEFDVYTKVEMLTSYLRTVHLYCIWCGATYNDEEDMESNCPGDTFDAHE